MDISSHITEWDLTQKRIFLRTDYNVPLQDGTILDTHRLDATLPTLRILARPDTTLIIGTHIGRPTESRPEFSTQQLIPWFQKHGFLVNFAPTLDGAHHAKPGVITLLENLRFFDGERSGNTESFARKLASLADYYVNDSFGTLHNSDTSTTKVPFLFSETHRSIGLLIEKEVRILNDFMHTRSHPFIAIIGGAKVSDKIPLVQSMLSFADAILICPAIAFTFLKAMGKSVGTSYVEDQSLAACTTILTGNHAHKLYFPLDYQISSGSHLENVHIANSISQDSMGISIGPKTIQAWTPLIEKAGTVFFNGALGFIDTPKTLEGMHALLMAMKRCKGKTMIAGGDSVAIAHMLGITGITHYALGGGAALAYLSGQTLPGLAPFMKLENRAKTQ